MKLEESKTINLNQTSKTVHVWIPEQKMKPTNDFILTCQTDNDSVEEAKYQDYPMTRWLIVAVELVQQARNMKKSDAYVWELIQAYKFAYIKAQIMTSSSCNTEIMRWTYFAKVMDHMGLNSSVAQFASHGDNLTEYRHNVTSDGLKVPFWFFSFMIYCPPENSLELFTFFDNLIGAESPRTVILAAVNGLKSTHISKLERNKKDVEELYENMDIMFRFRSGEALVGLTIEADLRVMMDRNLTVVEKLRQNITDCLDNRKCHQGG